MTSNLFSDLQHKVVLVTGSSSGIGEAIVTLFSQLGAYVVVTGRNADKVSRVALKCEQLSPFNYKPLTFVGDLMKDENIEQLVKQTIEKHSKIDVLVNNAGSETTLLGASLLDADFLEKYEKVMRLEVATRLKICRLTMPSLIESKGVIINTSSVATKRHEAGFMIHAISKAAVDMVTKSLALEFGSKGVRVNSVNPGYVKTTMCDNCSEEEVKNASLFQRMAEAEEIAKTVAFLASNTSSFVTGITFVADGGWHLK